MNDALAYWNVLCDLRNRWKCWVRLGVNENGSTWKTRWGQLLIVPVEGYLEASGGPVLLREVEWAEFATKRIKGGMAGLPIQRIDITEDLLSAFRETRALWELRDSTWSIDRILDEEPVQVIRALNPYGPGSA